MTGARKDAFQMLIFVIERTAAFWPRRPEYSVTSGFSGAFEGHELEQPVRPGWADSAPLRTGRPTQENTLSAG